MEVGVQSQIKLDDTRLQKLLSKGNIKKPSFTCSKGHEISCICISPSCRSNAFICNSCDFKAHLKCSKQFIDNLYYYLMENIENQKIVYKQIYKMGIKVINLIRKSHLSLAEDLCYMGHDRNMQNMIKNIFVKQQIKDYNGDDMEKFKSNLIHKQEGFNNKQLQAKIESTYLDLKRIIQKDFHNLNPIKTKEVQLAPNLQQSFIAEMAKKVKMMIKTQDLQFILESLGSISKVQSLIPLYRASENKFSAKQFHKKCDNIEHTFTLIRTQFGRTIAGYTPLKWNQVASNNYAADYSKKSFLLQVDLKQKMTITQPQYAIYCHSNYGPSFGHAYDIWISDQCNYHNCGYASFPISYNFALKPYETNSEATISAFSGATKAKYFKVLEYEVFKVQFVKEKKE